MRTFVHRLAAILVYPCPAVTTCKTILQPHSLRIILTSPAVLQVLRETGCLNGVITTDSSKSDEELVAMTKNWTIVGQDLLSVVSCKEPYEWKDPTEEEWEFNEEAKAAAAASKQFKVSSGFDTTWSIRCSTGWDVVEVSGRGMGGTQVFVCSAGCCSCVVRSAADPGVGAQAHGVAGIQCQGTRADYSCLL